MLALTDGGLQLLFFHLGKYLLLGSSREGSQPANLVGIWAEGRDSPWNGDYHLNINLQMMYWAVESLQVTPLPPPPPERDPPPSLHEAAEPLTLFWVHELARSGALMLLCVC